MNGDKSVVIRGRRRFLARLFLIAILGGLLIMMGQHPRSETWFYYFRLEDQVPETHLLRLIDKHISFALVREKLKESYSDTGRPSIDPELMLRILLIGYRYGITRERKLVEELRMHLAWRWYTGLGFDQEIPHHSTFSKNRHGRFQEWKLFEQWPEYRCQSRWPMTEHSGGCLNRLMNCSSDAWFCSGTMCAASVAEPVPCVEWPGSLLTWPRNSCRVGLALSADWMRPVRRKPTRSLRSL
jgi:transposase